MSTLAGAHRKRAWRSRAFVQPLLLTIAGVAITALVAVLTESERCTPSPEYQYECLGNSISRLIGGLFIFAVGGLITGFLVCLSCSDSGLAFRAVLVAVVVLSVTAEVASDRLVPAIADQFWFPVVAVGLLVPITIGFGAGRLVKGNPERGE